MEESYRAQHGCATREQQKPGDPDQFKPAGRSKRWLASCTGTVLPNLNWKIWDQNHLQRDSGGGKRLSRDHETPRWGKQLEANQTDIR